MSEELVLYTNPMSRGRIAHYMLEEVGQPYRLEILDLQKGENKAPEFLKLNPMGKVPTLVHRGVVISEAAAICTYLADAFPQAGLAPAANDLARGTYLRWLFFGAGCIEPALVDRMFSRPIPERPGALGYGSYADVLNALEQAVVPGPFILGEKFSAADVYLGSQIGWGLMVKALEPRQAFREYSERIMERPAFQRFSQQIKPPAPPGTPATPAAPAQPPPK
jgi:glutathione S-transferase